jgi:PAS domain S-box-containing protein
MGLFCDPEHFLRSTDEAVEARVPIDGQVLALRDGRVLERDYLTIESDGNFYGHVWTYRDVTAAHRVQAENIRLKGFYEQVLNALPAQVAVFDAEARFLYVNQASIADAAVRQWVIGRTNDDYCVFRGVPSDVGASRTAAIRTVFQSGVPQYFEESFVRHGRRHVIERSLAPIIDASGRVVQVIGFGRDFTVMREAQEALVASEERLRLALHGADLGTWDLDLLTGIATVNDRFLSLVGLAPGEMEAKLTNWRTLLHPEEAAEVGARFTAMATGATEVYESEHRLRHKSGGWVWVMGRGRVTQRAADGTPLRASGTQIDITERREALDRLMAAQAEAAEATATRERFLASISHELRTPLNAIVGLSHHLSRGQTSPEQARAIEGICYSADNLLAVINDLLDITRIRAGHVEFDELSFELAPMLSGLINSLQGTAQAKGLALTLVVDEAIPNAIIGDPVRLNQVLSNLVGNALKFTKVGGVTLRAESERSAEGTPMLCLSVTDTGIGIAAQDHERIFEPFRQASSRVDRMSGGTGLGLSIVRELVQRMGGTVELTSEVGQGSTFRMRMPLLESDTTAVEATPDGSQRSLVGLRVLVVEDNEMNSYVARVVLEHAGAHVSIAENGRIALERLQEAAYDVVLMDIQMPEMDGFETSWNIRNTLGLAAVDLPIIALTATAMANEQRRAQASGMTDYVLKPFNPDTLCQRIGQVVERVKRGAGTASAWSAVGTPSAPAALVENASASMLAKQPPPQVLRGARILLVDDNEMNRRVATLFLEEAGAAVVPAEDGESALARLRDATFDLVLMDVQLPGLDGFETTRAIRETIGLAPDVLPVVGLTATALSEHDRRTRAAQMSDYILKPYHPDALCARVSDVLERQRNAASRRVR